MEKTKQITKFPGSLVSFVITSFGLWIICWLISSSYQKNPETPWLLWPNLFMGIFLITCYIKTYRSNEDIITRREYDKQKNNPS